MNLTLDSKLIDDILNGDTMHYYKSDNIYDVIAKYYVIINAIDENEAKFVDYLRKHIRTGYKLLISNPKLINVTRYEDNSYTFELVQTEPIEYRLEFKYTLDGNNKYGKLEYIGDGSNYIQTDFAKLFCNIFTDDKIEGPFRDLLIDLSIKDYEYQASVHAVNALPLSLRLCNGKVTLSKASSNNIIKLFEFDFINNNVSWSNDMDEYMSLFKIDFKNALSSLFVKREDVEAICHRGVISNYTVLFSRILEKNGVKLYKTDEDSENKVETYLDRNEYYYIKPDGTYELIKFDTVHFVDGQYEFVYRDESEISIPASRIVKVYNRNYGEGRTSSAHTLARKLGDF